MVYITNINYDLLLYITNYLSCKEFCKLTQSSQYLYRLQQLDWIWKKYCLQDFNLAYKHPNQTFKELYYQCKSNQKLNKRLPCVHFDVLSTYPAELIQTQWNTQDHCSQCSVTGIENLFICLSPDCYQIVCDRHARHHSRKSHIQKGSHYVFYKPNMSELFCQQCIDWVGGLDATEAERHYVERITTEWLDMIFGNAPCRKGWVMELKSIRRCERQVRWKDTPQSIMSQDLGFCFISSRWMAEWEMFIEGWSTEPPFHTLIDQTHLLASLSQSDGDTINPFHLSSEDHVMIISKETWDYISTRYVVKGNQITEDDLTPKDHYQTISKRIEFWKKRANSSLMH